MADSASAADSRRDLARETLEGVFRRERLEMVAVLIRLTGDFSLAEDALQEAFAEALLRWPRDGVPPRPGGWILTTAKRRAIDVVRRAITFRRRSEVLEALTRLDDSATATEPVALEGEDGALRDDRLRLLFTCCHPALSLESQVALTLRMVAGLTTREIARAFLSTEATMGQRLSRAKKKIREASIPFRLPAGPALRERLDGVLGVIYLVFNEGYLATDDPELARAELCDEAIRLARVLNDMLPEEAEVEGLLALMLLHHSRRGARIGADGELITLEHQDRSAWDRAMIDEGKALIERALRRGRVGVYQLQAAIAALHAEAARAALTDWAQIAALYALLMRMQPSAVVELNHAVAVGMAVGPHVGLALLDRLAGRDELGGYHLLPAARAELLIRGDRPGEAAIEFARALELCTNPIERKHLERRLALARDTARVMQLGLAGD